ncbi:MAG TPA: zf-HC2 domain-containing protein [Blastocatellia bacterium]|nr:zf-HC2 domain-containing protein [Blastocatellia bacterium]
MAKMNCTDFEELISDYLECGLASPTRRSFAEHLLACRPCHDLFNDVRDSITACHQLRDDSFSTLSSFEERILNVTTAGEMLSCRTLDALISDYFDGLIEGSYEILFKQHFVNCAECRPLVEGVRASLEESEAVEVSEALYQRILAATSGARR